MRTIELLPAYGRKYATLDEAHQAWKDGKDFQIWMYGALGPYCSIRDVETMQLEYGIDAAKLRCGLDELTVTF